MKLPQWLIDFISLLGAWACFSLVALVPLALVWCVYFHFNPVAATWLAAIATPLMLLSIAFLTSVAGSIDMNAYPAPPDPNWHLNHSFILVGCMIGALFGREFTPGIHGWLLANNSPPILIDSALFPLFVATIGLVIGASIGQVLATVRYIRRRASQCNDRALGPKGR